MIADLDLIAAEAATEGCSVVADATTGRASAALIAGALRRHESSRAATILRPTGLIEGNELYVAGSMGIRKYLPPIP